MKTNILIGLRALAGAVAAEAAQIVATILWVAVYSYGVNPGQPVAAYEAHAQVAGPWVSILAGAPIFYAASRWIAGSRAAARWLFVLFLAFDLGILASMAPVVSAGDVALFAVSYLTKAVACELGGRLAGGRSRDGGLA